MALYMQRARDYLSPVPRLGVSNAYSFPESEQFRYFAIVLEAEDGSELGAGRYFAQLDTRQGRRFFSRTTKGPPSGFTTNRYKEFQLEPADIRQRVIYFSRTKHAEAAPELANPQESLRQLSRNRIWIGYDDSQVGNAAEGGLNANDHDINESYRITVYLMEQNWRPVVQKLCMWPTPIGRLRIDGDGVFRSNTETIEPRIANSDRKWIVELHVRCNADSAPIDRYNEVACEIRSTFKIPPQWPGIDSVQYPIQHTNNVAYYEGQSRRRAGYESIDVEKLPPEFIYPESEDENSSQLGTDENNGNAPENVNDNINYDVVGVDADINGPGNRRNVPLQPGVGGGQDYEDDEIRPGIVVQGRIVEQEANQVADEPWGRDEEVFAIEQPAKRRRMR